MTGENVVPHEGDTALATIASSKIGASYQTEVQAVYRLIEELRHEIVRLETVIRDMNDSAVTEDELRSFLAEQGVLTVTAEDLNEMAVADLQASGVPLVDGIGVDVSGTDSVKVPVDTLGGEVVEPEVVITPRDLTEAEYGEIARDAARRVAEGDALDADDPPARESDQ